MDAFFAEPRKYLNKLIQKKELIWGMRPLELIILDKIRIANRTKGFVGHLQTPIDADHVFCLQKDGDKIRFRNLATNEISDPGDASYNFIIHGYDPTNIYCLTRVNKPPRAGHTSLSEFVAGKVFNTWDTGSRLKMLLFNDRDSKFRLDVLFAGEIQFEGGKIISWSNDSGHYKPTVTDATLNIPAPLQLILQMSLFRPYGS